MTLQAGQAILKINSQNCIYSFLTNSIRAFKQIPEGLEQGVKLKSLWYIARKKKIKN